MHTAATAVGDSLEAPRHDGDKIPGALVPQARNLAKAARLLGRTADAAGTRRDLSAALLHIEEALGDLAIAAERLAIGERSSLSPDGLSRRLRVLGHALRAAEDLAAGAAHLPLEGGGHGGPVAPCEGAH